MNLSLSCLVPFSYLPHMGKNGTFFSFIALQNFLCFSLYELC